MSRDPSSHPIPSPILPHACWTFLAAAAWSLCLGCPVAPLHSHRCPAGQARGSTGGGGDGGREDLQGSLGARSGQPQQKRPSSSEGGWPLFPCPAAASACVLLLLIVGGTVWRGAVVGWGWGWLCRSPPVSMGLGSGLGPAVAARRSRGCLEMESSSRATSTPLNACR